VVILEMALLRDTAIGLAGIKSDILFGAISYTVVALLLNLLNGRRNIQMRTPTVGACTRCVYTLLYFANCLPSLYVETTE
jgi:hypothetical protein